MKILLSSLNPSAVGLGIAKTMLKWRFERGREPPERVQVGGTILGGRERLEVGRCSPQDSDLVASESKGRALSFRFGLILLLLRNPPLPEVHVPRSELKRSLTPGAKYS